MLHKMRIHFPVSRRKMKYKQMRDIWAPHLYLFIGHLHVYCFRLFRVTYISSYINLFTSSLWNAKKYLYGSFDLDVKKNEYCEEFGGVKGYRT